VRLEPESEALGAIVVAKPRTELRDQWLPLVTRLAVAFAVGALLAGLLAWWLSRRITGPVLALSDAADEIAAGNYAVRVRAGEGGDEISHLSQRFNEMAARLAATEERERQFLMSVSHELRTPLTAIKGHVDAIRDGLFDDREAERASLDVVAGETIRLERLVGDVLDLAKLNAHRFTVHAEEVDIGALVGQAHASFGEEARRRGLIFRFDEDPEAPTIVTDGDRVLQVLTNLLANAFRWTPDDGTISIGSLTRDGSVLIDVRDTGPGIQPDERERIFVPFISRDNHGTGLGLPIAREIALALGGRVELESTVGEGSRFRLVLPERPA
jgi:two-component system sensor histidine kinase BaeS